MIGNLINFVLYDWDGSRNRLYSFGSDQTGGVKDVDFAGGKEVMYLQL